MSSNAFVRLVRSENEMAGLKEHACMEYALNGNKPIAWHCESEGVKGDRSHYTLQLGTPEKPEGWMFEMQTCIPSDPDEQEAVENGVRLIEAAPTMLDALRELCELTPQHSSTDWNVALRKGAAAIAKATGEQQ